MSIATYAAAQVAQALLPHGLHPGLLDTWHEALRVGAALLAGVIFDRVNLLLTLGLMSVALGKSVRELSRTGDGYGSMLAITAFGVTLALLIDVNPAAVLCAVPVLLALSRAILVADLGRAVRIDGKTGLLNHAAWSQAAAPHVGRAHAVGAAVSLLLLDLDHFKSVNDDHSHLVGDQLLVEVAAVINACSVRPCDLKGRFGGEEFLVLLAHTDAAGALVVAERLRGQIAALRLTLPDGALLSRTVSIGVATSTAQAPADLTELQHTADKAVYQAKHEGRNRVVAAEMAPQAPSST